ncbi:NAD(P)H-hydrate dehydratase [Solibaculum mannosilyticum]|uniref:Bifunctional NAD(P)H-hydrate repair enzyme n=1 Tax=Solibaculum mannosilyticum TaxID=2780922 RepID=A0A7I8D4F7_9FIRM|nr:NAD(P)H-hydrate dehydratase [Solibaculum mannosilyticum]BCI60379.1 bifunctional NAD(P)H-hydrate repair enzyme Nnr [Solibaculum mannosilyticum]
MNIYNAKQTRQIEAAIAAAGTDYLQMMEQAGQAVARNILCQSTTNPDQTKAVILCGQGNNGGDGLVVARRLCQEGWEVSVVFPGGLSKTPDSIHMLERLKALSVSILDPLNSPNEKENAFSLIRSAHWIVDALFGIGFHGIIGEPYDEYIKAVEESKATVVAIDIPSGAHCDTGLVQGPCIQADHTVTFFSHKPAHLIYPAAQYCGKLKVEPLSFTHQMEASIETMQHTPVFEEVKNWFPSRHPNSHKGSFGKLLCICGKAGMTGAAELSAKAAMRCGAGLTYLMTPKDACTALSCKLTEPVLIPLSQSSEGTLSHQSIPTILEQLSSTSACLIGCGMGDNAQTQAVLDAVLQHAKCPVIIDADGINALSHHIDRLKEPTAPVILTPHPGEMSRLTGKSIAEIQENRLQTAMEFVQEYPVTLVLKGAGTIIALPDGHIWINSTGNPGMAKGGSGDVLAGMISAFVAQGIEVGNAVVAAVYLHGLAGDRGVQHFSQHAMLASDLISMLPGIFLDLEK